MTMKVKDASGTLRTITSMKVMDGSTLRRILRMKVLDTDGTTLRTVAIFAPPLSLSVSPTAVRSIGSDSNVRSGSTTATPTGGLGPYSYSWAKVSGTSMAVTGAATATATFQSPALGPDETVTATYRCTCSDSSGQTATADVSMIFNYSIA